VTGDLKEESPARLLLGPDYLGAITISRVLNYLVSSARDSAPHRIICADCHCGLKRQAHGEYDRDIARESRDPIYFADIVNSRESHRIEMRSRMGSGQRCAERTALVYA
jgi:hypothetical protein